MYGILQVIKYQHVKSLKGSINYVEPNVSVKEKEIVFLTDIYARFETKKRQEKIVQEIEIFVQHGTKWKSFTMGK